MTDNISTSDQKVDQEVYGKNYDDIFRCPHRTDEGCDIVDICENEEVEEES